MKRRQRQFDGGRGGVRGAEEPIAPDDARLEHYRAHLTAEEFAAVHAWLTTFLPFQLTWLLDEARFAVACKARQIGWTHTTAGLLVLWAVFRGEPCTIVSKDEKASEEVLSKCAWHVRVLREFGCESMTAAVSSSREEIVFAGGGRIVALPSTGGRSFSGNLFLDEYAYHQHPERVWDAAAPTTMLGYKMRVVSTPNGVGNDFHRLWERARRKDQGRVRWSAHEVPLSTALDQGYPVDVDACWTVYAKGDARLFDQLFGCSFLDAVMQYVPTEKIDACRTSAPLPEGGLCYAGLDVGREVDLSCLVVVRVVRGVARVVHVEAIRRTDSDGLESMVGRAFERFGLRRLCVDSTGMGSFPTDRIKKRHGDRAEVPHRRNRVEGVDFTLRSKEALATNLYTMATEGQLALPEDDAALPPPLVDGGSVANAPGTAALLRKEIASIRRVVTPAGNVTFDTLRTNEGHGDRAWALALALFAVDKKHPMIAALENRASRNVA